MDYSYRRAASAGFEQTRETVEREAGRHGFAIAHVHDIQATLAAKGFPIQPLCIYELMVDGEMASRSGVGLLMPCRLHVYVESGEVWVGAIRPTLMGVMFPEVDVDELARSIEDSVVGLVDTAAGCV